MLNQKVYTDTQGNIGAVTKITNIDVTKQENLAHLQVLREKGKKVADALFGNPNNAFWNLANAKRGNPGHHNAPKQKAKDSNMADKSSDVASISPLEMHAQIGDRAFKRIEEANSRFQKAFGSK